MVLGGFLPQQQCDLNNKLTDGSYNPATQAKGFTTEQVDRTRSKKSRSEWALQDIQEKVQARF